MDEHTWTVAYMDGGILTKERVTAENVNTNDNGDLAFGLGLFGSKPLVTRLFAAGVWREVSLHA